MSLQVEKLEHNMAKLTIEVSAEEVEKALQAAYLKERSKISLPGFRKGKVPRQMIEKMYGPEVFYDEAANRMISEAYAKAYDESELEIASQPTIDIVQLEKGKPFIFTAEVAVKPEVKLGEYKGLKVDKYSTRVTQKEVDEEIEKVREQHARIVEVTDRAVADKDDVTLDFEGFVDGVAFEGGKGENYPLTIGSGSFIPGFEEQLIGAEIDKEVEVKVTFPEDYHSEDLKGKEAVFKCTVHAIRAKELPEVDDEFASDVSEKSGGQLQRALLGRAIISDPSVLILDEPSTYIDKRFEARLYELLTGINKECAIILVSHDIGTVLQQVKSIACVNETLDYHPDTGVTTEWLEKNFNCPIELLGHGTLPHRILGEHHHHH